MKVAVERSPESGDPLASQPTISRLENAPRKTEAARLTGCRQAQANLFGATRYSRDHRSDCKQVLIALVVTFAGFPLGYEVFAGNIHDSRTMQTIVATACGSRPRHGEPGEADMATHSGRRYIIGALKSELKKFAGALATAAG